MTIKEIFSKFEDRTNRYCDISEKVKMVEADISRLDEKKRRSVKNGSPEQAIGILRERRDKEDELQILRQVMESIKNSPVTSHEEISRAWANTCAEIKNALVGEALPELKEAYHKYEQAIEAIAKLHKSAQGAAYELKRLAKIDNIEMHFGSPFLEADIAPYKAQHALLSKINSIYGGLTSSII
jgi:hypothetical protein